VGDAEEDGRREKSERLSYWFKFQKRFSKPCIEWLELIETMCNEIIGNYTKKEDLLMTAAFGTREKRRLNWVMNALNFEYPDYDRLDEGAEGAKRKRVVSILKRQAIRSVKEDQRVVKKQKVLAESKDSAPKKRKPARIAAAEMKVQDVPGKTAGPSPSSSIDVEEILKVMTEPFPFAMLSPLGSDLTSLLQSKEKGFEQSSGGKETALATQGNVRGSEEMADDGRNASHPKDPALGFGGKNCCAYQCRRYYRS
jgi:hypothetical protein